MKSTRNRVITGVLAVGVFLTALAVTHSVRAAEMRRGGMFSGHMTRFFTEYLDLSDAQQAQVQQILTKDKPALQPLMQQMHQNRQQMRQLIESGAFDETKARALASQQTQTVTFHIPQSELAIWNTSGTWVVEPGTYTFWVGGSSEASLSTQLALRP